MRWGNLGQWGNLGHFRFSFISLKQNGLTAGTASMDCISPLPSEMSTAVPSRHICSNISDFFKKINFLKK